MVPWLVVKVRLIARFGHLELLGDHRISTMSDGIVAELRIYVNLPFQGSRLGSSAEGTELTPTPTLSRKNITQSHLNVKSRLHIDVP